MNANYAASQIQDVIKGNKDFDLERFDRLHHSCDSCKYTAVPISQNPCHQCTDVVIASHHERNFDV